MTFDKQFWNKNREAIEAQMMQDYCFNHDGSTMIGIEFNVNNNMLLSNNTDMIDAVRQFFDTVDDGRVFLHYRMATGPYIGLAFNHVIPNFLGQFIMHNGVIKNPDRHLVDSFAISKMGTSGIAILNSLVARGDTYANIFCIDPEYGYCVVRLQVGSLYCDDRGNYSTNQIAGCNQIVPDFSCDDHMFDMTGVNEYYREYMYEGGGK
jgi:hypothetical protein